MKEKTKKIIEFNVSALNPEENRNRPSFIPSESDYFDPFLINDPFNLRRAIVPVFATDNNVKTYGMGTAFNLDCWGTFITADHVIEPLRSNSQSSMSVLLGYGLVFGTVNIPSECFAQIQKIEHLVVEKDDPLKVIRGNAASTTPIDIARIDTSISSQAPTQLRLPLNKRSWIPAIGDPVLAIGYPELECKLLSEQAQNHLLTEGMHGAFGIIRAIHPKGSNSAHLTPVLEIDATWPSGMSGGPVFNSSGEVIGLVSRSLLPEDGKSGVAFATCFNLIPNLQELIPSVNLDNPFWRMGWGIIDKDSHTLLDFVISEELAKSRKIGSNENIIIQSITALDTDNYVYNDHQKCS